MYGCLQLKNDPGIDHLSQTLLQDRNSEMALKIMNIIDESYSNKTINDDFIGKDTMIKLNQKEFLQELPDNEIATHIKNIEDEKKLIQLLLLSTTGYFLLFNQINLLIKMLIKELLSKKFIIQVLLILIFIILVQSNFKI